MKVSTRVLRSCLPPTAALSVLVAWAPAVNAGGHLDGAYGVGGYFLEQTPDSRGDAPAAGISEYTAVAIAAGGEIYAVGFGSDDNCGVVAVSAAGEKVPGWGGDTATGFPCWEQDLRPSIAVHDDGRVVIAYPGGWQKLLLRRWTATGDPDPQFGAEGLVAVDIPFVLFGEPRIQAAPDGTVVVAFGGRQAENGCPGDLCAETPARLGVVRLSADGSVAASSFDLPPPAPAAAAYLHPIVGVAARVDGSITVVVEGPSTCNWACFDGLSFIRLAADGTTSTRIAQWPSEYGGGMVIELHDDVVHVARYEEDAGGAVLYRFDLAGNPKGIPVPLQSTFQGITALGLAASGALHAIVNSTDWRASHVAWARSFLRRYRPDGQHDSSFAETGIDYGARVSTRAIREAPAGALMLAAIGTRGLAAVRLSLGDGDHPGRIGIVRRLAYGETGTAVGQGNGDSTTINQRDTTLEFAVDRTGGSQGAVGVTYRIDSNAAAAGAFEPADGRLQWNEGEHGPRFVSLDLKAGAAVGEGARVELRLTDATGGATIGSASHVINVLPPSPGRIEFAETDLDLRTFREGLPGSVAVLRRGGGNGTVSIRVRRLYASALGRAASPDDFSGPDDIVLTWEDGETGAKSYALDVRDDRTPEPKEYFRLQLHGVTGGASVGLAMIDLAIDDSGNNGGSSGGGATPIGSGRSGGGGALGLVALLALASLSFSAGAARRRRLLSCGSGG